MKASKKLRSTIIVKGSEWKKMPQRTKAALAALGRALMLMTPAQLRALRKKSLALTRLEE